jgi:hypothetical protein
MSAMLTLCMEALPRRILIYINIESVNPVWMKSHQFMGARDENENRGCLPGRRG